MRIALEGNRRGVHSYESINTAQKRKLYVFVDYLAERAKNPKVLREESLSTLLGGTETTANLLSNLLEVLARQSDL